MKIDPDIRKTVSLEFSKLASEKNKRGEKIISLGLGEPGFETPLPIIEATYDALKNGYTKYSNPLGLIELRELIRDKLLKENQIKASIDNIIVTPGAKQALSLALMALLEPYDEVINFTPCYVSYVPQIKIAEPTAVIRNIDLKRDDFSLDWVQLEENICNKTKLIILNFPHNPTGKMLSKQDIKQLVQIVEKYGLYVISDEIYEMLNLSDIPNYSIGAIESIKEKVVTINGFSKAFAMTGWRIGYLVADTDTVKIVSMIQQHTNTNTCTFVQKGACAAFALNKDFIDTYKMELSEKVSFMVDVLGTDKGLQLNPPQGGLFAFLNISNTNMSSDTFSSKLLMEEGVATTPGIVFGKNWDDHIRISLATEKDEFKKGIKLVNQFAKEVVEI